MRKHIEFVDRGIEVSDKEIESYMDFDSLLERDKMHKVRNQIENKITRKLFWLVAAAVLIGTSSYFLLKEENSVSQVANSPEKSLNQFNESITEVFEEKKSNTNEMVSANKFEAKKEQPKNSETLESKLKNDEINEIVQQSNGLKRIDKLDSNENFQAPVKESYVYIDAEPIDGIQELYKYFEENLKYPEEALTDSIQGTVLVRFTILKDGKVDNLVIEKTLGPLFDLEAKRLINGMPLWKPATVNDTPVVSRMSIPLHFNIKK